jgi:23S rRNA pseudouridine1911/1915/1917 synthase
MLEREDFVCGRAHRLDALVAAETELSRTQAQRLIRDGQITLNGESVKPNAVTSVGDLVEITYPEPEEVDVAAEDIPLDVLYEDEDLLVVNKPQGMVVHPAPGHATERGQRAAVSH